MQKSNHEDWLTEEADGELAIDVYQDEHNIYIVAPLAGVRVGEIDVSITDEVITIRGGRKLCEESIPEEKFFTQECYWGQFSRSYTLPMAVYSEEAKASLKDGLLRITIPKDAKVKTKVIAVNSGEAEKSNLTRQPADQNTK